MLTLARINFGGLKIILNLAGINFGGSQKKLFLAGANFGGGFFYKSVNISSLTVNSALNGQSGHTTLRESNVRCTASPESSYSTQVR